MSRYLPLHHPLLLPRAGIPPPRKCSGQSPPWPREHDRIPDIAANIPVVSGIVVPTVWPGDRFDIIWCFTLAADGAAYRFTALPELLLSGDGPA